MGLSGYVGAPAIEGFPPCRSAGNALHPESFIAIELRVGDCDLDAAVVAHREFEGLEAGGERGIYCHRIGDVELLNRPAVCWRGVDFMLASLQRSNQVGDDVIQRSTGLTEFGTGVL